MQLWCSYILLLIFCLSTLESALAFWFSVNTFHLRLIPYVTYICRNYASESPEMQLRRLGDLCFMFQLYEQAYSVYHTLKKDFEGDKTWMYCAGSQVSRRFIEEC